MKTLLILRHAKSSWDNPSMTDFERPLNKRGLKAAPRMGRLIADEQLLPELIISSTAVRARTTADLIVEHSGYKGPVEFSDDLYLAPSSTWQDQIAKLAGQESGVMVIGHNPGLEQLVRDLTGEAVTLPTAALAVVDADIDQWRQIGHDASASLRTIWCPRDLD